MADNIAKMRAALNDGTSVTVQGISPEQLSAMQTATNYANANYPQTEKQTSILANVPSLDDISNFVQNFPVEAQRFLTNPQVFTQAITGKNPLPEETGFAASFTGLPEKNPNSLFTPEGMAYSKGYETGEPYGIAAQFTPAVGTFAKPTAKMLAEMANKQIMETGGIKLPGMPEIPVVNYAVKPKGGNNPLNLGGTGDKQGVIGEYLQKNTFNDPIEAWVSLLPDNKRSDFRDFASKWFSTYGKGLLPSDALLDNNTVTNLKSKELLQEASEKFVEKLNEERIKQGLQPIPNVSNVKKILPHFNNWVSEGPYKTYITSQFGTGLPTDPVLKAVEKYNLPLRANNEIASAYTNDAAESIRERALRLLQEASKAPYKANIDPEIYKNVGKQTATTPEGMFYENASDAMVWPRHATPMLPSLPYESKLPMGTPIYDLSSVNIYDKKTGLPEIRKEILHSLSRGEIPIENLKNVSVERIAEQILQRKHAEQIELGKSKQAYEDWVKTQHSQVPIESPMLGTPPAVFADGSKMALFDEVYAKNNPDMFLRQLSIDTKDLDHCVAHCGHNTANDYKRYAPAVEPHTGVMPTGGDPNIGMNYPNSVKRGQSIIGSLRDPNGHAQATMEINPAFGSRNYSKFKIPQIMGLKDSSVNPQYQPYIKSWLNQQQNKIDFVGQDHGLKNISSFDLHDVGNPRIDFIGEISKQNPFFPKGMLDTLFMEVVNKENILDPGLKQAYQSGHIDPKPLFSKYLPRFFDSTDLLSFADKMGVDIMEHPSIMSKPHVENAGDMINQLENHRNFAEKIGDIAASDRFTKMIQKVTNRIVEIE
jgi:hypothetical protein